MTVWTPTDDGHADLTSHDTFAGGAPHNTFKRLREQAACSTRLQKLSPGTRQPLNRGEGPSKDDRCGDHCSSGDLPPKYQISANTKDQGQD